MAGFVWRNAARIGVYTAVNGSIIYDRTLRPRLMTCRMTRANGLAFKPVEIGVMFNLPNLMITKPIRQSAFFLKKTMAHCNCVFVSECRVVARFSYSRPGFLTKAVGLPAAFCFRATCVCRVRVAQVRKLRSQAAPPSAVFRYSSVR